MFIFQFNPLVFLNGNPAFIKAFGFIARQIQPVFILPFAVPNQAQFLFKGARIGQLVITPIVIADFVTDLGTERGTGSFGSTGE